MANKSEWRVSYNPMLGEKPYQIYRLRDKDGIDHSGNREYFHKGENYRDRAAAEHAAKVLNNYEKNKGCDC